MFPDRGVNLLRKKGDVQRIVNSLYKYVNVSVLLKIKTGRDGTLIRYIDQVCFFTREEDVNNAVLVVENGKLYKDRVPHTVRERIEEEIGGSMFSDLRREGNEKG